MGLAYNTYLTSNKIYGCKTCKAHLANHEDIISRVRIVSTYAYVIFLFSELTELLELPRPAWQSVPVPSSRQHRHRRSQ